MKNISVLQGRTPAVESSGQFSRWVMSWINTVLVPAVQDRTALTIPGPFVDDVAAAAGGVAIGSAYYITTTGAMVVRLT